MVGRGLSWKRGCLAVLLAAKLDPPPPPPPPGALGLEKGPKQEDTEGGDTPTPIERAI